MSNSNNTFFIKCIKNVVSEKGTLVAKAGTIYKFTDGIATWEDGTTSIKSDSAKQFLMHTRFYNHFVEISPATEPGPILSAMLKDKGRGFTRKQEEPVWGKIPSEEEKITLGEVLTEPTFLPIGIIPKSVWYKERKQELKAAIKRYMDANAEIPLDWIAELNELIRLGV